MVGTDKTAILCAVFSFFASQATMPVQAASTSVGVSINFAVAPADLFSTRNIDPTNVRLCESLKAREIERAGHHLLIAIVHALDRNRHNRQRPDRPALARNQRVDSQPFHRSERRSVISRASVS